MKFGRDLQMSVQSSTEPAFTKDKYGFPQKSPLEQQQTIANMLGLMGSIAVETIISDLKEMLSKNLRSQADGYIFALSRIMRHDLAWQCILESFTSLNEPIPTKYYPYFGQTNHISSTNTKITVK